MSIRWTLSLCSLLSSEHLSLSLHTKWETRQLMSYSVVIKATKVLEFLSQSKRTCPSLISQLEAVVIEASTAQVLRLRVRLQWLYGAKHSKGTYGHVGFYNAQASYFNMKVPLFAEPGHMHFLNHWVMTRSVDTPAISHSHNNRRIYSVWSLSPTVTTVDKMVGLLPPTVPNVVNVAFTPCFVLVYTPLNSTEIVWPVNAQDEHSTFTLLLYGYNNFRVVCLDAINLWYVR